MASGSGLFRLPIIFEIYVVPVFIKLIFQANNTISLFPVQINTTPADLAVKTVIKLIWRSRCYNVIIIPSKS